MKYRILTLLILQFGLLQGCNGQGEPQIVSRCPAKDSSAYPALSDIKLNICGSSLYARSNGVLIPNFEFFASSGKAIAEGFQFNFFSDAILISNNRESPCTIRIEGGRIQYYIESNLYRTVQYIC